MTPDLYRVKEFINLKLRAKLRRTEAVMGGDSPNMWCEVLERMQNGFSHQALWDEKLYGDVLLFLDDKFNDDEKFLLWLQTDFCEDYLDELASEYPDIDFDINKFPKEHYLRLNEGQKDDLAKEFLDHFYYEDNYDLEEEQKKGKYISIKYRLR